MTQFITPPEGDGHAQKILAELIPYAHRNITNSGYFIPKAAYLSGERNIRTILSNGNALVADCQTEVETLRKTLALRCQQADVIAGGYVYMGQGKTKGSRRSVDLIVALIEQRNGVCFLVTQDVLQKRGRPPKFENLHTNEACPHLFVPSNQ